jgi:signal transduction histidine kinase
VIGWAVAAALGVCVMRLRRRLELVACAEHELRGPLTAFALGLEGAKRGRPLDLDAELERARTALADLTAARRGRRAMAEGRVVDLPRLVRSSAHAWGARLDWRGGPARVAADEGRLAQALGNLLSNAVEHGGGEVSVSAERHPAGVRVDVVNSVNADRGRGLAIAAGAAREAGARISLDRGEGRFRATLDVPVVR